MEGPDTSIRNGPASVRARSKRASEAGFEVDIAGLPTRMIASDAIRREMLEASFGSLPRCAEPARAEICFTDAAVPLPRRAPDADHPDLRVWYDGDVLYLETVPLTLVARVAPQRADIGGVGDQRDLRGLLHPVITHMLGHVDIFVVHAAAVRRGGKGVLVVGETGQGKSTMALAALEHGWGVLADDLVGLEQRGGVYIRGVPKPMALPGDLDAVVLSEAASMPWDGRNRRHFPAARLDASVVPLRAVVLVGHADTPRGKVEECDNDRLVSILMESFASVGDVPLMRAFFPVAAAAARVPAYRVGLGRDPDVRLSDAARMLDDVISAR
jgi:hypothetical protein